MESANGQLWNTTNGQWWNGTSYQNWDNGGSSDAVFNTDGAAVFTIGGAVSVRNISRSVIAGGSNLGSITFQSGNDGIADALTINGQIDAESDGTVRQVTFRDHITDVGNGIDAFTLNGNFSIINLSRVALTEGVKVNATISVDKNQSTIGNSSATVKLVGADTSAASIQLLNGSALDVTANSTVNNLRGSFEITNTKSSAFTLTINNLTIGSALDGSGIGAVSSSTDPNLSDFSVSLGAGTHTFELDADAMTADKLAAATIALGGTLVVNILNGVVELGDSFDLFDGTISGNFTNLILADISGLGLSWDTSQLIDGGSGVLTVVPESGFFAAIMSLMAIALVMLRKRYNGCMGLMKIKYRNFSALMNLLFINVALFSHSFAAVIEVNRLLDDSTWQTNPDGSPGAGSLNVWRYNGAGLNPFQWQSTSDDNGSAADTFNAGSITLTDHTIVTSDAEYDVNTTRLTGITPSFSNNNGVHISLAGTATLDPNAALEAYYTVRIKTTNSTYIATSNTARILDGSRKGTGDLNNAVIADVVNAWNILAWDVDPFGGNGIVYASIESIDMVFYTNQAGTNAGSTGASWFNFRDASVSYQATTVPEINSFAPIFGLVALVFLSISRKGVLPVLNIQRNKR